jgi:hypothetical protein
LAGKLHLSKAAGNPNDFGIAANPPFLLIISIASLFISGNEDPSSASRVLRRTSGSVRKTMKAFHKIAATALALVLLHAPSASALTIITTFIGGDAPVNAAGGGNLLEIVQAAAHIWESAYADTFTLHLYVGWGAVGDTGTHTLIDQGGIPNREITGAILFDNSGAVSLYLDPTPNSDEEYRRRTDESQDLGGGMVNVARVYSSPIGDAAGRTDLLSVALHEIGHALGMCTVNSAFIAQSGDGFLWIGDDLPYAGTVIPLASNNAGFTSHFDAMAVAYGSVMAGLNSDERRIPSALDILADAQVSNFTILSLDPGQTGANGARAPRGNVRVLSVRLPQDR